MAKNLVIGCFTISVLSGCLSSGQNNNARADLAALDIRRPQCAEAAGISGTYSVNTQYISGSVTQEFVPGPGVSKAQAAKANACMKG